MSLSQEQQNELERLNELFKKFEATATDDIYFSEEPPLPLSAGESIPMNSERLQLDKMAAARRNLLNKGNTTVVQKVSEDGSIQLSFE